MFSFTDSPFPIDTAVIKSSHLAVLCRISVLTNISKFTKSSCDRGFFWMKLQIYRVLINFIKKRLRHKFFLVNFATFLITSFLKNPLEACFRIKTCCGYCPTMTVFKISHIFPSWVFSRLNLKIRNQSELNISNPLPEVRSPFSTQSYIWNGSFFRKNSLKPFRIFAKKLYFRCWAKFQIHLCKQSLKGVTKWNFKTWELHS